MQVLERTRYNELDELVELADEPEALERFFAEHGDFFVERVRAFYGGQLRGDVHRIAFELMRLELAAILG